MHADGGMAGAGAPGDEADAGPAGQLAIDLGHVCRCRLVPAGDELDLVGAIVEGVERGEIAFPRHAEHHVDAVYLQLIDQHLATGAEIAALRHCLVGPL